ncbi:MAG: hypothetical protein LAT63_10610 [Marinobacter sp.]|nr:hypothetical protein [Marinobacter sp.]
MKVTQLTPIAGTARAGTGEWLITQSNNGPGRRFRQVCTLQLATGGLAEGIHFTSQCTLALRPDHYTFNAVPSNAPERAIVTNIPGGKGARISLSVPRLVSSIRYQNSIHVQGKMTQLYRTDGDVITEEPFHSHFHHYLMMQATTTSAAPAARFERGMVESKHAPGVLEYDSRLERLNRGGQVRGNVVISGLNNTLPPGELGIEAMEFIVRLENSGSHDSISSGNIAEVNLTTGPESLRLGIELPALGEPPLFLPGNFTLYQTTHLNQVFRDTLQKVVDRYVDKLNTGSPTPALLPGTLELRLVMENDAPLKMNISAFAVDYHLVRESLPEGLAKQVLRFDAATDAPQAMTLQVPGNAIMHRAELTLAGKAAKAAARTGNSAAAGAPPPPIPAAAKALRVSPQQPWASRLILDEPILADRLMLCISSLAPGSRARLTLHEDHDGMPYPEVLARAGLDGLQPRGLSRLRCTLQDTQLLQPGDYWLVMEVPEGRLMWHLQPRDGAHLLTRKAVAGGHWGHTQEDDGFAAIAALLPQGDSKGADTVPGIQLGQQMLAVQPHQDDLLVDLRPGLVPPVAPSHTLIDLSLSVRCNQPGPLTLYPPRLEYDLSP